MAKRKSSGSVPKTTIHLGGRKYTLRLDFNAFARVERETGSNMLRGLNYGLSAQQLSALIWAAIDVPESERPGLDDIRSMMGAGQTIHLNNLIMNAIQEAMPDPEDTQSEADPEGNASGTGMSSSQSA